MSKQFEKTANEVLDYRIDFKPLGNARGGAESDYLEDGETINAGYTLTAEAGITIDSDARADTNTSVLIWLSGGTLNNTYTIDCLATTSNGRDVERSITIKIVKARTR